MQLKADVFNLLNNMSWGDPSTAVDDSSFGQSTNQADLTLVDASNWGLGWNSEPPFTISHCGPLSRSSRGGGFFLPRLPGNER